MKVRVNKEKMKEVGKTIAAFSLVGGIIIAGACSANRSKLPEMPQGESEANYEAGSHMVLKIDRSFVPVSESKQIGLVAPEGYRIIDYDYDRWQLFEFNDLVYINDEEVYVTDPDSLGNPTTPAVSSEEVQPRDHVIVTIDKKFGLIGQEDITFAIDTHLGYKVLDYDYDKTVVSEFENITYANRVPVTYSDVNEFGNSVSEIEVNTHEDGVYGVGEHVIVSIVKEANPWWGKDEMKQIVAPKGYRIVDYDYDKTEFSEYETITYENVVPVVARNKDSFGVPLEETLDVVEDNLEYESYTHVLVRIDRNMHIGIGDDGTRQLVAPDGYELLDYDYDINDDFEFETYVYINNKKVYLEDTNGFGTVIEEDKEAKLILTP